MKKLLTIVLLALTIKASGQYIPNNGVGRIFQRTSLPVTKPDKFGDADFMYTTTDSITYQWVNGVWTKSLLQLGTKNNSSGGASPSLNVGTIRWVSNETELREAVNGYGNGSVTAIYFTDSIGLKNTLQLPLSAPSYCRKWCMYLNGNGLYDISTNGLAKLISRPVPDQATALNTMITVAFIMRDGFLQGKSGTGTLLELTATYGSIIEGIDVVNANNGIDLKFCLMAKVSNSLSNGIKNESYIANIGNWSGASNSNSQSNHSRFEQCRVFGVAGAKSGFSAYAASGIVREQCIVEGGNTQYGVFVDGLNSTVVKDGLDHLTHIENSPSVAGFYIALREGYHIIDGIFAQYPCTLVSGVSQAGYPRILLKNIPYLMSTHKFQTNGNSVIWDFENIPTNYDFTDVNNWKNGLKPFYYSIKGFNQSPFWNYNSLKFNSKTPVTQ
jgi:hypothetical protein